MTKILLFLGTDGTVAPREVPNLRFNPTLYEIIDTRMIEHVALSENFCLLLDENGIAAGRP